MRLALRYCGHRCTDESAIKPWYFAGSLELSEGQVFPIPPGARPRDRGGRTRGLERRRPQTRAHRVGRGVLVAEDLRSTNDTQVNGVRCDKGQLAPGDALTLAGYFDFEVIELPHG